VKFAQSNLSIIDPELANIEIATIADRHLPGLRLTYQARSYDLMRVFATSHLDLAQQRFQEAIANQNASAILALDEYLLVREVGYYSLWEPERSTRQDASVNLPTRQPKTSLELQQASMWLLQEIWLQWQELLGVRQLQVFAEDLISIAPQLQSRTDLDRLLAISPMNPIGLAAWQAADLIAFDRQLYQLTNKKLGRQFGPELIADIVRSMPPPLQSILIDILDI
jgi:hypothetical protein